MHGLKPSLRAKKDQEVPGADYAAPEGEVRDAEYTGKVPEHLGVTVHTIEVDNLIGIIGNFLLFIMDV